MVYSNLKLFVLAILSSASTAFDPADSPCNDQGICLSSFIWCDQSGQACAYPDGADALIPGATTAYAVLYHHAKYDIRWRHAQPDTTILVEWLFDRSPFQEMDEKGSPDTLPAMWSTNVTSPSPEGAFTFDPLAILKTFPTPHAPDMSPGHAASAASGIANTIRISQPDAGSGFPAVYSSQFTVQSGLARQLVQNIRQQEAQLRSLETRTWKLGLGVGIILGVPLLAAVIWWAASRHALARVVRSVAGK